MRAAVVSFLAFMAVFSAICRWLHDRPGFWEAAVALEVEEGHAPEAARLRVGWRRVQWTFNAFWHAGWAVWLA